MDERNDFNMTEPVKKTHSIFEEQIARKPDYYPWTEQFMDVMHDGFWTAKEFDFKADIHDYKTILTEQEQDIIKKTLSAIAQVEVAVKTFWGKLGDNLPHPSLRDLGYVLANVEVIHNRAYEKLLKVLGLEDIFEENLKHPIIRGRTNYLRKYLHRFYKDSRKQYIYALILFTLFVENVSLFSQFYIVRWFGKFKNLLKDTNQQVKYTRLEEHIHAQVGIKLVNTIHEEHPELFDEELETMVLMEAEEAFKAESNIIDWIMGSYQDDCIDAELLKEYIKYRINDSLKQIGFRRLFSISREMKKKFDWMDVELIGNSSTDFFWQRPVEYAKKNKTFSTKDLFPDKIYKKTW